MSGTVQSMGGVGLLSLTTATGIMVAAVIASLLLFVLAFFMYLRAKHCWGAIPVSRGAPASLAPAPRPRSFRRRGAPFGADPLRGLEGWRGVRGLPLRAVGRRRRAAAAQVRPRLPSRVHRHVVPIPLHLSALPQLGGSPGC
ncbi:unnamed protein product [Musa textilis]